MVIKPATEEHEFLQIHQLNYQTFVEEIPQNQQNEEKILVDKFHHKNNYIIAKRDEKLVGMVCYNSQRPFSLDGKINDLDSHLPPHNHLAEIRLLSVIREERKSIVAFRLLQYLCGELIKEGIDAAVISGTTRQIELYNKIGFISFGPLVGTDDALYQPMYITLNDLMKNFKNG